jgi:hypothetical protein
MVKEIVVWALLSFNSMDNAAFVYMDNISSYSSCAALKKEVERINETLGVYYQNYTCVPVKKHL